MKPTGLLRLAALGLGLALVASLGCSPLPNSPIAANGVAPSASTAKQADGPGAAANGKCLLPIDDPDLVTTVEVLLPGVLGGHVSAPNVSVDVPAGAIDGTATVKITIPNPAEHRCELEITGAPNHFSVPVKLTFDCSDFTQDELRRAGVMWFDPQQNRWVQVDTQLDLTRGTASAELLHFSQYKVDRPAPGKASW